MQPKEEDTPVERLHGDRVNACTLLRLKMSEPYERTRISLSLSLLFSVHWDRQFITRMHRAVRVSRNNMIGDRGAGGVCVRAFGPADT